jgi:penicillin-binding protein 1A
MTWRRWLFGGGVVVGVGVAVVGAAGLGGWWWFVSGLPPVDTLANYAPAEATILYDRNGEVLGELYEERRYVVPIEDIPEVVQQAFVAAEDASFRSHGGVDYMGIARAALRNVDDGRASQGASTITQQVVKNLILDDRTKSIERKLKEVALAWELESQFDKDYILFLYLNSIYLGAQSYGVEAAARTYFGKRATEMTLGEAALIAGLPQRPSDYNPYKNMERAKQRQDYVLKQMVAKGFVTQEAADEARAQVIELRAPDNAFLDNAPDFTEHVRRLLVERFGEEAVNKGGLRVVTTCDLTLQRLAKDAVMKQVTELDRQSGFRRAGRVTLSPDAIPAWRAERASELPLEPGRVYEAVALSVASDRARLAIGDREVMLAIEDHRWISPRGYGGNFLERLASEDEKREFWQWRKAQDDKAAADAAARLEAGLPEPEVLVDPNTPQREPPGQPMLREGDLLRVTLIPGKTAKARDGRDLPRALLYQDRELEGALLSMELETGAVRALVGGADFGVSQFNRATQGRRQVGSTFKPFVYAAAIEKRSHTAATVVSDMGVSVKLANDKYWTPRGSGDETSAPMTLTVALARSRNAVLVRTLIKLDEWMDGDVVYSFARRLGLGGPPTDALPADWQPTPQTQYLCPWTSEWVSAEYCRDHQPPFEGEAPDMKEHRRTVKEDTEHLCRSCDYSIGLGSASLTLAEMVRAYSAFGSGGKLVEPQYIEEVRDRHGELLYVLEPQRPQVIDPGVAYIVNSMLQAVVTRGTGHTAKKLNVPLAGKTGTTDEGRDAWFIGMSPRVVTGVWVGFDTPQPIGQKATGGRIALPVWIEYMRGAVKPDEAWPAPSPEHVVFASIDEGSGLRSSEGGVRYPFLPGTVPGAGAPKPVEVVPVEEPPGLDVD